MTDTAKDPCLVAFEARYGANLPEDPKAFEYWKEGWEAHQAAKPELKQRRLKELPLGALFAYSQGVEPGYILISLYQEGRVVTAKPFAGRAQGLFLAAGSAEELEEMLVWTSNDIPY